MACRTFSVKLDRAALFERAGGAWSHLLTTTTSAFPASCAYPAIFASSAATPSLASPRVTTTSASRICLCAMTTLSFSAPASVRPLRRIPAVSTN